MADRMRPGRLLRRALLTLLRMQGVRTAYSFIRIPNEGSRRLHESMGFARVGVYHKAGYKAGAWQDIGIYEREITPPAGTPVEPTPVWKLDPAETARVLTECAEEAL